MAGVVVVAADTSVVAAADTLVVVAADTLVVAAVAILAVAAVDTSVVAADTLPVDASRLGMGQAPPLWLGVDPDRVYVPRQDIAPTHLSPANTAAISGMAVGGITALARAGYGRTTTVSTYGPAAKDRLCYFIVGLKPPPVPTFSEPRRTVATGAGLFHTVIRVVSAQNISRHANADYRPASSDRVRGHRMRHLLRHARRRVLCPLADRTVIQAKR
jgi:hypothetical protein